ncbi:hypothetical protein Misp01_80020 [Microtetraspora sp. NBRC 13810]|uniref:hypothetical protein n=1 Tax=Microtetraspora sp. NBRC 13810 TaxID=3030990 RepID=UPI0024A18385|nr:hypothetical protein [Microtetraspora sp. NBRC 13810]GLW12874.1 hypothetical protein Misp01_80020 [Microtetraspora sp. NBRC 13810]
MSGQTWLPIPAETVATVHTWLAVRATIASPTGSQGFLFPPAGEFGQERHLISDQISPIIRAFADAVPQLLAEEFGPDGRRLPFDRSLITPYGFRHAYCQPSVIWEMCGQACGDKSRLIVSRAVAGWPSPSYLGMVIPR